MPNRELGDTPENGDRQRCPGANYAWDTIASPHFHLLALGLLLAGCAYVGEPLPPSLGIPERITDVSVVERGDKLLVSFTAPEATTDGVLLKKLERVELRVGTWVEKDFDLERWAAQARVTESPGAAPGAATVEVPAREWTGREVIVAVRAWGRKDRASEWSNLVVFRVVEPLERPAGLKAEASAEGVRLSWQAVREGAAYRIWRDDAELAAAKAPEYVDAAAQYGRTYQYAVQAVLESGQSVAESEVSGGVSITPEDRFPPAPPAGLTAVAGVRTVALSWERNTEPDLKGYYLYRSEEGGAWQRLGALLETPAAGDRAVEPGRRYRYAVSAVDLKDNESPRSEPVEIAVP